MPRLCPHCHKLGISVWKTLMSAAGPVECSYCHSVSRRKNDWSRYILMALLLPWFVIALVFHIDPNASLLIAVPLLMVGAYYQYRFSEFVPINPPEKTRCASPSGS